MAAKNDYYSILGVSKDASPEEMKKAYRKQAIKWHPDKHKGEDKDMADRKFKEINEAYQILSDTQKRQAYDQYGHNAFSPGGTPGGFGGQQGPFGRTGQAGPFTYTYSQTGGSPFSGFDFEDPFEIFEQFFGGNPFGARQGRTIPRYGIDIEFMEAIEGVEKEILLEGGKRKIKIPPGVNDGSRIRFGDFILSINVKPHDIFERDGDDIHVKVLIPFSLATLGGTVEVPIPSGEVKLKVRAGTQSGKIIRLKGKGASRLRGRGKGDEYVHLSVSVPQKLDRNQKKMIDKLKDEGF